MSSLVIYGGRRLSGEIYVHGAKNSVLPILSATLLADGTSIIHNCPNLADVDSAVRILRHLGCRVKREEDTIIVNTSGFSLYEIPESLMREMRSSVVFLGAVAAKLGKARLCSPGGCNLGPRPINLHLDALRKMGLKINECNGFLDCEAKECLRGAEIHFPFPSVGATENVMIAASLAEGVTVIRNAAREPEISDLAAFLNRCGGKVSGAGTETMIIEGVPKMSGTEHRVIPDRIVAATYLSAAAVTAGNIALQKVDYKQMTSVLPFFEEAGCRLKLFSDTIQIRAPKKLRPMKWVETEPYPGFPTDAQAPLMAVAAVARGTSIFEENIFENRYRHVPELRQMGADILVQGKQAVVRGVNRLHGCMVEAPDLRGGASLIVAGLSAWGKTTVSGIHHIDRGYEKIEDALALVGAEIRRQEEWKETGIQEGLETKMCI